jgi:hypothetical protein
MKDIVVSMAVSRVEGMLTENVRRLSSEGITVSLESIDAQPFTIASKLTGIRRLAHQFSDYEFLLISDGWDVLFYGTKPELISRIPRSRVLWAAEKNCWPYAELEDKVPDRGPWRFVNGGLLAGTPENYLAMCRLIEAHPLYNPDYVDQGFMNFLLARGADFFGVDSMTKLFFCLFKGYDELIFKRGRPFNSFHGTWPLFVHANGHWPADEMFQKYEASLA